MIAGLLIGLITTSFIEVIIFNVPYLRENYWDNPKLIFGYHFHHSLLGLLFVITGLFAPLKKNRRLLLIGIGLGIIIIHTISDGRLIFIE